MEGLVRVAAAVPHLRLGNVEDNLSAHLRMLQQSAEQHVSLVVFPELSLTGYTCGDLFFQKTLLAEAEKALIRLAEACPEGVTAVAGIPIARPEGLYNCAAVISAKRILGIVPKIFLPNNQEFYEKRWFRSGHYLAEDTCIRLGTADIPMTSRQLFTSVDGVRFGVEICEDLWSPLPPSTEYSLAGAQIILNPSASNELISKREYRKELVCQQSARCLCGYVYASAGCGESSSDLIFSGHSIIAANGCILKESAAGLKDEYLLCTDIDLDRIDHDRVVQSSFGDAAAFTQVRIKETAVPAPLRLPVQVDPQLSISPYPFIPSDPSVRELRCNQIFDMQAAALARRLKVTGGHLVVGISGGLDSTLALLAACRAMDLLQLPRTNVLGITMPCFGTTDRTHDNALQLMDLLGVRRQEIPIHSAVRGHFRDIGHNEQDHSVVYENAQARERTQILMDVANQEGAIVLGTGDLSEIALGWSTYNADHMSMYGINSGIPKTLVRWIIRTASTAQRFSAAKHVLEDILDTPISPELLPPDSDGNILQQTEDLVGPYALHDFFLYYVIRFGYTPQKVFDLCCIAFRGEYGRDVILKWLKNFYRRFWTQQFKRNCMPDGVKIGSVSLSPRGDWRMPSDAECRIWLDACEVLS